MKFFSLEDVINAKKRIKDFVIETPLIHSEYFSKKFGFNVYFKCDFLQKVGSFKIRGVANKVLSEIEKGTKVTTLVTESSGNHGIAVAYFAKILGLKSVIFVPKIGTRYKINLMKLFDAEIIRKGEYSDDAAKYALKFSKNNNALYVHSYDDLKVIEGQATLGLEIYNQLKNIDYVIVPVGGGGLIAGISFVLKSLNNKIKIIGIQSKNAPSVYLSLKKNKIIKVKRSKTIAEGIAVRVVGNYAFEMIKQYVDNIELVSESNIIKATLDLFKKERLLLEPTGASAFAYLYNAKIEKDSNVIVILTGRNVSNEFLYSVLFEKLFSSSTRTV
jgi:threonine dehydratase